MPADEALAGPGGHVPPSDSLPLVLVPGLITSPRLYAPQLPALWQYGPVVIADNTAGTTAGEIASAILATAPPRFALAGLSMGGYIAMEIMRQAPHRVAKLALLDTTARADTPAQTQRRQEQIAISRAGRFSEIAGQQWPLLVSPANLGNNDLWETVRLMAAETGAGAFIRQQQALISRPDSRPDLAAIDCPTMVLVGEHDRLTPPDLAAEIADGIPAAWLVTIPGAGHLSTLEQPGLVTSALEHWLRRAA